MGHDSSLVLFLILFPLVPAAIILFSKPHSALFRWTAIISSALIGAASVKFAFMYAGSAPTLLSLPNPHELDKVILACDVVLAAVFLYVCRVLPFHRLWIPGLVLLQYVPFLAFELKGGVPMVEKQIAIDNLSVIMVLIIGVVGGLIALYTVGYMKTHHEEHPELKDRSNQFVGAVFMFFSAMFGIVLSNNVAWIYLFWEVTTLCSFIMISYSRSEEAMNNAFRALWMLMIGGLAFAVAIIYLSAKCHTVEIAAILSMKDTEAAVALFPVILICFAGMNKAAQFPFSSWLLGAMVAPTPSSALLHSSTMVKAGVYVALRFSPLLEGKGAGLAMALVGGVTFLAASGIGVSESNGKRVLAYSTVANLGLIILCAGIGTPLALWAGVLLMIFHALAKALLFLAVGKIDHMLHSVEIESMRGLITRSRSLTILMLTGIAGMFLAPFGVLISKWGVLEALARRDPILPLLVIFGSSLMLFFWGKWMGALVAITGKHRKDEGLQAVESAAMWGLAVLTVLGCALFPLTGIYLIEPMYGHVSLMVKSNVIIISIMTAMAMLLPFGFLLDWKGLRVVEPYLGGANVSNPHHFMNSLGKDQGWKVANYYLVKYFGEPRLLLPSNIIAILLTIAMIACAMGLR